ncbi:MAG: thioesterase family protein [Desulfobacterales bacterium]
MARIELNLPEMFSFSTDVRVRISDINYGNHLGNDAVLSLIHEARLQFLQSRGFSELDIDGCGLILTDAVILYKSQGFHGDLLTIFAAVDDFNKYGCDFFYKVIRKNGGKEVARAKTGIVFFDYNRQKMVPVPAAFLDVFRKRNVAV